MRDRPSFHDLELLSAYLDGELREAATARLVARLKTNPQLQAELNNLHQIRLLLRNTPRRCAPRNFTLTPKMAGLRAPAPRSLPALRFAAALATILLALTFAVNYISPLGAAQRSAEVYGIGGGEAAEKENLLTEQEVFVESALPQEEYAAPSAELGMATQMPAMDEAGSMPTATVSPASEAAAEALPPSGDQESTAKIIPSAWQAGLAVFLLICVTAIVLLRWNAGRQLRKRMKQDR